MDKFRIGAVVLVLVLTLGAVPGDAEAQTPKVEIRLTGYFGSLSGNVGSSQFARANYSLYGPQATIYYPNSGLGFGGELLTGSMSSGEGIWLAAQRLDAKLFSAWVSYNFLHAQQTPAQLNVWAGYGKSKWDVTNSGGSQEVYRNRGFMLGVALYAPLGNGFEVGGRLAYTPAANVSLENGGVTNNATGSSVDYTLNFTYERGPWGFSAGYRARYDRSGPVAGCPDCNFNWQGYTLSISHSR